jgi:hypothetical protein
MAEISSDVRKFGLCHGSEIWAPVMTLVDFEISALSLTLISWEAGRAFDTKIGFKL